MNDNFVLYYISWHDREISLVEMREMLVGDLGQDGLAAVIKEFREERQRREQAGDYRTYYEITKAA